MLRFKQFVLLEGGNVKVKDSEGKEVSAAPFSSQNRTERAKDVHDALMSIHNSFHKATGKHLFGKDAKALQTGSAYSGSTKQFMNKDKEKISDSDFSKHKSKVGDVDVQVAKEHKEDLAKHFQPGQRHGKYTVVGTKKSGSELHVVMRHDNGEHHQFDFEHVNYEKEEPTQAEQFLHSSSWEDARKGIKGVHHKILINAVASTQDQKFSITHGLRSRTNVDDPGVTAPKDVSRKLFGDKANHENVNSFVGLSELIKKHIPAEKHQEIYDKFKGSMQSNKNVDSKAAIEHLRNTLGTKD